jgi:predicted dinucleotide-binding enzyme
MKVLLVGAGNMGRGIATRLSAANAKFSIYDIDRAKAQSIASDLGGQVTETLDAAVAQSDIVILASWYAVNLEMAKKLGAALNGKIVVDISNPLNESYDALVTDAGASAAENIQKVLSADAHVLKAFNTTFAGTLVAGQVSGDALDVYIAGDDDTAKATLADLISAGGLVPIDVGPLSRSRELEALGFLGITLQFRLNTSFGTAWKLILPTT